MKCPYCNNEISDASIFCPECGQSVNKEQHTTTSENYWSTVANDNEKRNQEYLKTATKQRKEANTQKTKKMAVVISLIAIVAVSLFVAISITNANKAELEEVKTNLPGRELKCSYSRTEAGFWIHYYYYTLKFNSDDTLDYYYLTTVGPVEKDEVPTLQGTYTYTITRNILGDYFITFDNKSFTMKISDDNTPKSLSYGK